MTDCCFPTASPTGMRRRPTSRSMPMVCRSVEIINATAASGEVVRPSRYGAAHHRPDADCDRRPSGRRRAIKNQRGSDRQLVLGTLNNCAMGFTPWGTYLSCEENFNGFFFQKTHANRTPPGNALRHLSLQFGLTLAHHPSADSTPIPSPTSPTGLAGWWRSIRSIPNRRRSSAPRSAASSTRARGCRRQTTAEIVVYMGDDERNEYIYRYVSNLPWRQGAPAGNQPA